MEGPSRNARHQHPEFNRRYRQGSGIKGDVRRSGKRRTLGSAAEKAGIKRGDIITAINGERIEDSNVLRNKVAGTLPGTEINVTVVRDGKEQELTAKLDEFKVDNSKTPGRARRRRRRWTGPQNQGGKLGLGLQPVTPQIAKQLGLDSDSEGMVVTEVDPNGPAAEAGIDRGDVILEINKKSVNSIADVKSALEGARDRPDSAPDISSRADDLCDR